MYRVQRNNARPIERERAAANLLRPLRSGYLYQTWIIWRSFYVKFTTLVLMLLLVGCRTESAMLKNPSTGEIRHCGKGQIDLTIAGTIIDNTSTRKCIETYTNNGWVLAGDQK
jgi:hypothetical protein